MFLRVISIFFILQCSALSLFSQADVTVWLIDAQSQKTVSDISLTISNSLRGFQATAISDAKGKIMFKGLDVGVEYQLTTMENEKYYSASIDHFFIQSNTDISIQMIIVSKEDIGLTPITVNAAPSINSRDAQVASALRSKEIQSLPLEGRDITRLLYRLPNVVPATGFYPEAPSVSINGSNSLYTNYLIDGMDNNERFLGGMKFNIPVGFAQHINVLTNNFSTEYGNTGNGIVNITTPGGSNTIKGEVYFITRPGAVLDAASPYVLRDLSGNQVKDGFQRYQTGFTHNGAIKKNKTFYFINAEYTRDIKDNYLVSVPLGVNDVISGKNNFTYLSSKINHRWNDRFTTALRANVGIVNIARQGGGLVQGNTFPSAGNFQDRNSALVAIQNTYLGNQFKTETNMQYSTFRWNYGRALNVNDANVTVLDPQEMVVAYLGHPGYIFDSHEKSIQGQQKWTYYTEQHTLKAGVEVISSDHKLYGGGNANGSYTVKLTDDQLSQIKNKNIGAALGIRDIPSDVEVLNYSIELRPQAFGARQNIYTAYLEDEYAISSQWTIKGGVRYDYDNMSKGGNSSGDVNNIAPRMSINHAIHSNASLRIGYGMFYDKINYAVYSDALQQNTTDSDYKKQLAALIKLGKLPSDTDLNKITFDGNIGASEANVAYLQGPSSQTLQNQRAHVFSNERRILNPNGYQNPYTHQWSIGYQQQINADKFFYIDVVYNRSYDLFRLVDINSPMAFTSTEAKPSRSISEADHTRPIPIEEDGSAIIDGEKVYGVARSVTMTETKGQANYAAASFNLQKNKGGDNYSYRLIYTLSRLRNNTEDINFKAMDSNNFDNEWGPSVNDRTHVINALFSYFPTKFWSVNAAGLIQSGQPINRIPDATIYGTSDLNGDGRSFGSAYVGNSDRQPGESRNSDRLPWSNTLDISSEYNMVIGQGQLIIRADVFNVFNATNLSGYFNNATQSNQIQIGPSSSGTLVRRNAAPPRQFQFSVRYVF